MDASFWHERWAKNEIAFHEPDFHELLTTHFSKLNLAADSRVFVPLCGKTLDISWLLQTGYQVCGIELSETAVQQLFEQLGVTPRITQLDKLKLYQAPRLDIFVGDIFDMTAAQLGKVDASYDRAALVALPAEMRTRYARQLLALTQNAPQLLITFEYNQNTMEPPPHSVDRAEVKALYGDIYNLRIIELRYVIGGLKGKCNAEEIAWLLRRA